MIKEDVLVEPVLLTENQLRVEYNKKVETNDFSIYKFVDEIELTPKDFDVFEQSKRKQTPLLFLEQLTELFLYTLKTKLIDRLKEYHHAHSRHAEYLSTFCYTLSVREMEFNCSPYCIPIYVLTVYARMKEDEYVSKRVKEQYTALNQYIQDKQKDEEFNKITEEREKELYLKLKAKYEKESRLNQAVLG